MIRFPLIAVAAGLLMTACTESAETKPAADTARSDAAQHTVLAEYPAPTFLENLFVKGNAVYFTNYTGKTVEVYDDETGARTFASVDVHPVSLVPYEGGWLVVGHKVSFTEGEAFIGTGVVLRLDRNGETLSSVPLTGVGFANGIFAAGGQILVADSIGGQIVRFDPASGSVTPWLKDERLNPQTDPYFLPGANGLKMRGKTLYVSSSAARAIFAVTIGPDGAPAGGLEPVIEDLPGADDFLVTGDDLFLVSTHGDSVMRIAASGERSVFLAAPAILGNTAVGVWKTGENRAIVILGTGGFSEQAGKPAALVSVPFWTGP